jgi:hypothetical protein
MGLSKSKPIKPNQQGFQQNQQGFPSQPGFAAQAGYQPQGFAPGFPNQSQTNFASSQPGLSAQAAFAASQPAFLNGKHFSNIYK